MHARDRHRLEPEGPMRTLPVVAPDSPRLPRQPQGYTPRRTTPPTPLCTPCVRPRPKTCHIARLVGQTLNRGVCLQGHVRIELFEQRRTNKIEAHTSHLSCMALNLDGSRLVTASEKGTILRIFDTLSGKLLQEVRLLLCFVVCFFLVSPGTES